MTVRVGPDSVPGMPAPADQILPGLRHGLIVSCQPRVDDPGDPMGGAENMARLARAAVRGGAAAIRALAPDDVRAIAAAVEVPVIGLTKTPHPRWGYMITPGPAQARVCAEAGASIVAFDATSRPWTEGAPLSRDGGTDLGGLVRFIRETLGCLAMADCASEEDAQRAAGLGADLVATTYAGYVGPDSRKTGERPEIVAAMARHGKPVVAEGGIWTPDDARRCLDAGAWAVCVGSAITRPQAIAERFLARMAPWNAGDAA